MVGSFNTMFKNMDAGHLGTVYYNLNNAPSRTNRRLEMIQRFYS
ncbi:hypothetical protein [Candidatus Nitrosocosmicus sp. R]